MGEAGAGEESAGGQIPRVGVTPALGRGSGFLGRLVFLGTDAWRRPAALFPPD